MRGKKGALEIFHSRELQYESLQEIDFIIALEVKYDLWDPFGTFSHSICVVDW